MSEKIVLAILPKAGLGNKLYVWAKATVFSYLNQTELITFGWTQPSLGPFFRREKSKRLYLGQFKNPKYFDLSTLLQYWIFAERITDPDLVIKANDFNKNELILFKGLRKGIPDDSFRDLKPFRFYLKDKLQDMLTPKVKNLLSESSTPVIGIHVRRGDFRQTSWMTSLDYFCGRTSQIRYAAGKCLPVTVFSDGSDDELAPLLDMPGVKRAPSNPEIVDMLLLSRSKVLVTCPASTFSNWAAFLSDGVVIRDYLFPHKDARPQEINQIFFEGIPGDDVGSWPTLLLQNLRNLK
jgi:hypothetical protein